MLKGGLVAVKDAVGSQWGSESCERAIQMLASTDVVESAQRRGS